MKHIFTSILFALSASASAQVQTSVADFENFNTAPNTAYSSTTSAAWQTANAVFPYQWNSTFGIWEGGFSYTNKYDSSGASFSNLHGVKAYKGYNNSSVYTVGQDRGTIRLKAPFNQADGFYITNTTFAYKAVRNGNSFARKFGDTTGTGSGTTIPQGSYPDWFKITVKGYFGGNMKNDSVEYYLADYVIDSWQWVNTTALGQVDSIRFFMYSSDVGQWGINTPLFFAIDNFTTSNPFVGLSEQEKMSAGGYPNPFNDVLVIRTESGAEYLLQDLSGKTLLHGSLLPGIERIQTGHLALGVYFLQIRTAGGVRQQKLIKG
jgi:hypothetical protein